MRLIIIFFLSYTLIISCNNHIKKKWNKDTLEYTKEFLLKKNLNSEFNSENIKRANIVTVDKDSLIFALYSNEILKTKKSSITYFFINPKNNAIVFKSTSTVNGCGLDISSFVITDINNDGNDDFVFLELYNKNCQGNYWIKSGFEEIRPSKFGSNLDYYLEFRNDTRINRKIDNINYNNLQKRLEKSVNEYLNKKRSTNNGYK